MKTQYQYQPKTHWSLNKLNLWFTLTAPYKCQKTVFDGDDDDDDDDNDDDSTQQCLPPMHSKIPGYFFKHN